MPITSGGAFASRLGFGVPIVGLKTHGIVRCDQPLVLDLQMRKGQWVETLPANILDDVMARLNTIFA